MKELTKYQPNDVTWYDYVERVLTTTLPYETRLNRLTSYQAEEWCRSTFGPRWSIGMTAGVWTIREVGGSHRFSFAEEKYKTWFQLRWS